MLALARDMIARDFSLCARALCLFYDSSFYCLFFAMINPSPLMYFSLMKLFFPTPSTAIFSSHARKRTHALTKARDKVKEKIDICLRSFYKELVLLLFFANKSSLCYAFLSVYETFLPNARLYFLPLLLLKVEF